MSHAMPFGEVLDAADHLSPDEQQELVAIIHRRLSLARRQRLAADIQEARTEFAEGRCTPKSPEEIMSEILQ